jgi:hypothetical protein
MRFIYFIILTLLLSSCVEQQRKEPLKYPIAITLEGDTPFGPEKIGEFERGLFLLTKGGTTDNSLTYTIDSETRTVKAQRFLYEVYSNESNPLKREYDSVKRSILAIYNKARLIGEKNIELKKGSNKRSGYHCLHRVVLEKDGISVDMNTETYIFMEKDKFIKFRITYPATQYEILKKDIKDLIDTLVWVKISQRISSTRQITLDDVCECASHILSQTSSSVICGLAWRYVQEAR